MNDKKSILVDTQLLADIRAILSNTRTQLQKMVNSAMVGAYWQVGERIVKHDQQGKQRAIYGQQQLEQLSAELTQEFGKGFDTSNLRNMRRFYLAFPIQDAVRPELSWTHYRQLIRVENLIARKWYMEESIAQSWSARALDRQISKLYYERLLSSQDKVPVEQEAAEKIQALQTNARDFLRDPYVLDFLNLPYQSLVEKKMEQALIDNLQTFLLELGKGFAFVARQQRITTDNQDFYKNRT